MVEVALDTLVCCTLTALAILTSGALTQADHAGAIITAAFSGIFGSAAPGGHGNSDSAVCILHADRLVLLR